MMQEYNEKFHEEPEETETTQKDTFSKKINAKINEYIDKNVNNKQHIEYKNKSHEF